MVWVIFADKNVDCKPGLPLNRESPFDLVIDEGLVVTEAFHNADTPLVNQLLERGDIGENAMPLGDFFRSVYGAGVMGYWLLRQAVWCVAAIVECAVLAARVAAEAPAQRQSEHGAPPDALATRSARHRLHRMRLRAKRMHIKAHEEVDLKRKLLQCYLCARRRSHEQARLSFAFDASRVGMRSLMLGYMADSKNVACWLPHQANGATQRIHRRPA